MESKLAGYQFPSSNFPRSCKEVTVSVTLVASEYRSIKRGIEQEGGRNGIYLYIPVYIYLESEFVFIDSPVLLCR